MSMSVVTQKQSLMWSGSMNTLRLLLERIGGPGTVESTDTEKKYRIFNCIDVQLEGKVIIMEWQATPVNDMFADTVLATLLQSDLCGTTIKGTSGHKGDRTHFKECLVETLQDMFGEKSVPKMIRGDEFQVTVGGKKANVDLQKLEVACPEDEQMAKMIHTAVHKLYQSLVLGPGN